MAEPEHGFRTRRRNTLQGKTSMFSDTKFWRLVWKEYRTQRALWLTLLIVAPVLQAVPVALMWWSEDFRPLQPDSPYDSLRMGWLVIGYLASGVPILAGAMNKELSE